MAAETPWYRRRGGWPPSLSGTVRRTPGRTSSGTTTSGSWRSAWRISRSLEPSSSSRSSGCRSGSSRRSLPASGASGSRGSAPRRPRPSGRARRPSSARGPSRRLPAQARVDEEAAPTEEVHAKEDRVPHPGSVRDPHREAVRRTEDPKTRLRDRALAVGPRQGAADADGPGCRPQADPGGQGGVDHAPGGPGVHLGEDLLRSDAASHDDALDPGQDPPFRHALRRIREAVFDGTAEAPSFPRGAGRRAQGTGDRVAWAGADTDRKNTQNATVPTA